jgi:hypothetical protein
VLTSQQFVARVAGVLLIDAIDAAVAWRQHGGTPPELLETFDKQHELLEFSVGRSAHPPAH